MTGLRELFEDAAGSSSPPSRLLADDVYAAGRRRLHRRRSVAVAAAVAVLATLSVTGVAAGVVGPRRTPAGVVPAGRPTPAATAVPHPGQPIQSAAAADASHLYLSFTAYPDQLNKKGIVQLVRSTDGGRTWSDRGGPVDIVQLRILAPDTLIGRVMGRTPPKARPGSLAVSTDGASTWNALRLATPVAAVPPGSTAVCWSDRDDSPCQVYAVDPAAGGLALLANQPRLSTDPAGLWIEQAAGRLWVAGFADGRPAVAVSLDAGRTWSTHVFGDAPACGAEGCRPPAVATADGRAGYVVVTSTKWRAVYRRTAGGGWQRITGADAIPTGDGNNPQQSFVAADGRHVLFEPVVRPGAKVDVYRFWAAPGGPASPAGDPYRPVELTGLPNRVHSVSRTPSGWFYALDQLGGDLYGSSDGWHWTVLTRR
jgi:hypothetical protein